MTRSRTILLTILGAWALVSACGEGRGKNSEFPGIVTPPKTSYLGTIEALLHARCAPCHGATRSRGHYRLTSWRGLLGPGSDGVTRNAIPGDQSSKILDVLDDATHASLLSPEERESLQSWVVVDRMAYFTPSAEGYHPQGWLYPGNRDDPSFHGGALRATRWDMSGCKLCHGDDLRGGLSKIACTTCHKEGPQACTTCHGDPSTGTSSPPGSLSWCLDPATCRGVGAHEAHVEGGSFTPMACSTCHVMPERWDTPGHLADVDARSAPATDLRAEIFFGPRAKFKNVKASYDPKTGSCKVYCHGDAKVTWTKPGSVPCGSCHPVPHAAPHAYGGADCATCHSGLQRCPPGSPRCLATSKTVGVRFVDPQGHGDGKAHLRTPGAEGTCWGCHGTQESEGAPAPDLAKSSDATRISVGLHALHLRGSKLIAAVACADCHRVPQLLTEAGHIDSDLPAEIIFSDLARGKLRAGGKDLAPTWDRATATCSNVYCHSLDGRISTWVWNANPSSGTTCNACHGMPPKTMASGQAHPASTECVLCHHGAYKDGFLDPKKHINGKLDLY